MEKKEMEEKDMLRGWKLLFCLAFCLLAPGCASQDMTQAEPPQEQETRQEAPVAEDPAPVEEEGAPAAPTQEEPTQEPAPAQGQLAGCAFRMESQPYGSDPAYLVFGEDGRFEAYNFDLWEMKEHRGTLQSSYQLLPDGSIRISSGPDMYVTWTYEFSGADNRFLSLINTETGMGVLMERMD